MVYISICQCNLQLLFTTDRTPSTLQDQESFKSDWQVIRKYSSL